VARLPRVPARPGALLLALALGGAGGWLATRLGLPLPWMIGSMIATTVAALAGAPVAVPPGLRAVMVTVLGVMLGSRFTPEILARLPEWGISLAGLAGYIAVAGGAGLLYFWRVAGYAPATAYFSAAPGGLSEMVLIGGAMGGDTRIISLVHSARLLLVILLLPAAFQWWLGVELGRRPTPGLPLLEVPALDLLVLIGCALAGYVVARALKLPAAALVGPMVLSAAIHLTGWTAAEPPRELVAGAQVVVGAAIGARFAGTALRMIGHTVLIAAGGTAIMVLATVAFAYGLHAATGLPASALLLAYSPGGLAEMSLIALVLSLDAAFVATHHILRIFMIVVFAPLVFRRFRRGTVPDG